MKVFIFGNGNISMDDFRLYYTEALDELRLNIAIKELRELEFIVCDFRGTDTLAMEYLKTRSKNVTVLHIGEKPRYCPDKFKTKVSDWHTIGGFKNDAERDMYAIENCTHFLAHDFNSDKKRKSGTQRNIENCYLRGRKNIEIASTCRLLNESGHDVSEEDFLKVIQSSGAPLSIKNIAKYLTSPKRD